MLTCELGGSDPLLSDEDAAEGGGQEEYDQGRWRRGPGVHEVARDEDQR